jgi:hypothetical protein
MAPVPVDSTDTDHLLLGFRRCLLGFLLVLRAAPLRTSILHRPDIRAMHPTGRLALFRQVMARPSIADLGFYLSHLDHSGKPMLEGVYLV